MTLTYHPKKRRVKKMTKLDTVQEVAKILLANDNFAILTHQYPDGDTLGSAYSLCEMLQQLGKNAKVFINGGKTPEKFKYLENGIKNQDFNVETYVSVDVADSKLLGELEVYKDKILLAIDHHATHKPFAENYYVCSTSASNCENMFFIANELGIEFTKTICNSIYTGVATDTGCFKYTNTTPQTHIISARLMEYGCDAYQINKQVFDTYSKNKKSLEAFVISNMEYFHNDEIAFAYTTKDIQKQFNINDDQLEGISAIPRTIEGVKVGITLREKDSETFKISVRTNDGIDASEICSAFGGGGHKAASGCAIKGSLGEVKEKLISFVSEYLDRQVEI